jgi:hypothetical protein
VPPEPPPAPPPDIDWDNFFPPELKLPPDGTFKKCATDVALEAVAAKAIEEIAQHGLTKAGLREATRWLKLGGPLYTAWEFSYGIPKCGLQSANYGR